MYRIGETLKPPTLPDESQLSELGIDFIRSCLIIDPMKRPTAEELFSHPWITDIRDRVAANEVYLVFKNLNLWKYSST